MCREFGQSWSVYVEDPDTQLSSASSALPYMSESDLISTQDGVWVPPVLPCTLAGFCCPRQRIRMILLLEETQRKSVSKMCDEASLLAANREAAAACCQRGGDHQDQIKHHT
jgi:hypothetical protein